MEVVLLLSDKQFLFLKASGCEWVEDYAGLTIEPFIANRFSRSSAAVMQPSSTSRHRKNSTGGGYRTFLVYYFRTFVNRIFRESCILLSLLLLLLLSIAIYSRLIDSIIIKVYITTFK